MALRKYSAVDFIHCAVYELFQKFCSCTAEGFDGVDQAILADVEAAVVGACVALGQAAGTAAAIAAELAVKPEDISVKRLQKTLLEQGAVIKGCTANN